MWGVGLIKVGTVEGVGPSSREEGRGVGWGREGAALELSEQPPSQASAETPKTPWWIDGGKPDFGRKNVGGLSVKTSVDFERPSFVSKHGPRWFCSTLTHKTHI